MQKKSTSGKNITLKIISIVACCAVMLVATFAWFTSPDASIVNTINASDLTLDLLDSSDTTLVGKTLGFVDGDSSVDNVVWAPGVTNTAQTCHLKNNGVVDIKYKVSVIGLTNNSGIADLIEWKVNGESINTFTSTLASGESSGDLVITGTMDSSAGNKYMNRTGDSIAIAIYAVENNDEAEFEEIVAIVRDLDEMPTVAIFDISNGVVVTGETTTLDAAFTFSHVPGAPEEEYADWNVDYVVSFNNDIAPQTVCLAGQYDSWDDSWLGFKNPVTLTAGQELRLLRDSKGIYKTYTEICNDVKDFSCGVADFGVPDGTVMTVDLRVYETENGVETGRYITAGSYIYNF